MFSLIVIMSMLIPAVFITVVVVIIVNVVKGSSSTRRVTDTVSRTVNNAFDGISQSFKLGLNDRGNELIPQITAHHPNFSPTVALGCAKEAVRMKHDTDIASVRNAAISDYTRANEKSTVVIEVLAALRSSDLRKFVVLYENETEQNTNCPHCGAPLRDSAGSICEYCGCQIEHAADNGWSVSAVMVG